MAPSAAVFPPRSAVLKVRPWGSEEAPTPAPKAPENDGWQTVSHSKKRPQVAAASTGSDRKLAPLAPKPTKATKTAPTFQVLASSDDEPAEVPADCDDEPIAPPVFPASDPEDDAPPVPASSDSAVSSKKKRKHAAQGVASSDSAASSKKKRETTTSKAASPEPSASAKKTRTISVPKVANAPEPPSPAEETPARYDRRPQVLWRREPRQVPVSSLGFDDQPPAAGQKRKATAKAFVKVSRATFDAATPQERLSMQVAEEGNTTSDVDQDLSSERCCGSNQDRFPTEDDGKPCRWAQRSRHVRSSAGQAPQQLPHAPNPATHQPFPCQWNVHITSPPTSHDRHGQSQPMPNFSTKPLTPASCVLSVRGTASQAGHGMSVFQAIASNLRHILLHDCWAFGVKHSPSARSAIHALCDPLNMRTIVCDHLTSPFADLPNEMLDGATPRDVIQQDYVDGGAPLVDAEPETAVAAPAAFGVISYADYIAKMRRPTIHGDEVCIAAAADLLGLRISVLNAAKADFAAQEPAPLPLLIDHHPSITKVHHEEVWNGTRSPRPVRLLSSRMGIVLVSYGQHFAWAHPQSDCWAEPPPVDASSAQCSAIAVDFFQQLNSHNQPDRPDVVQLLPSDDPEPRPMPDPVIIAADRHRRHRAELKHHLMEEDHVAEEAAEAAIMLFEAHGAHAGIPHLPAIRRLLNDSNLHQDPLAPPTSREAIQSPSGKHATQNAVKRALTATLSEAAPTTMGEADRQQCSEADSNAAIGVLRTVGNLSESHAADLLRRHISKHPGISPLGAPLQDAFKELQANRPIAHGTAGDLAAAPEELAPLISPHRPDHHELSTNSAAFISAQLGDGVRAMTHEEIIGASQQKRNELYTGVPADIIPRNLHHFWSLHQDLVANTPRGHMSQQDYNQRMHRMASEQLHALACDVARSKRRAIVTDMLPPAPRTREAAVDGSGFLTPSDHPATPSQPWSAPVTTPPQPAEPNPAVVATAPLLPPRTLKPHPSPAIKMAARESAPNATNAQQGSTINVVIDTGLPSTAFIWEQGLESEDKGYNYRAFAAVKTSWEQCNADKNKPYRSFKAFINSRFVGNICSETGIDRISWDEVSDTALLSVLEEKLKPTDYTPYLLRIRAMRVSNKEADGSLSRRYRNFADAFIQAINDAKEAGLPVPEEAAKNAFRAACTCSPLLMLWIGTEKWTSAAAVHQRIVKELRAHDAHNLYQSLEAQPTPLTTPAAAPLAHIAPPAVPQHAAAVQQPEPQRVPWTPEQRAEHRMRQQQQGLLRQQQQQLQQQQQQTVLANVVQSSVDAAWQRIQTAQQPLHAPSPQATWANHSAGHSGPATSFQPIPPPPSASLLSANMMSVPPAMPPQQAFPPQFAPMPSHPGLDHRGPFWHTNDALMQCRNAPCSRPFCQGCGTHGHCSAECRRRNHPDWNHSGYYCDKHPGKGPLPYVAMPSRNPAHPQQQPQPRIPVPPPIQSHQGDTPVPYPSFPTPHRLNPTPAPPSSAPVVRHNNASAQANLPPPSAPSTSAAPADRA